MDIISQHSSIKDTFTQMLKLIIELLYNKAYNKNLSKAIKLLSISNFCTIL